MHGVETYGIDLYEEFIQNFPDLADNVQLIIGNELAYTNKVRYIDVDMNRHYGKYDNSHESSEIKRVEAQLESFKPDYIIVFILQKGILVFSLFLTRQILFVKLYLI